MSKYIPEILKDKFQSFTKYLYVCIYGLVATSLGVSLLSFNINDNSFLTSSSQPTSNFLGPIGAHMSSFLFYTFGFMSYAIILFFLVNEHNAEVIIDFSVSLIFTVSSDESKLIKAGNNKNVINIEIISPKVIIHPKSIIGLIPLKTNDRNAHIVVNTV